MADENTVYLVPKCHDCRSSVIVTVFPDDVIRFLCSKCRKKVYMTRNLQVLLGYSIENS